ncbi:hypothetical protein NL500_29455, partial [Klebsiella pneumoniae]|nr:hypothetical protein [Klebsiella pneumoniae]
AGVNAIGAVMRASARVARRSRDDTVRTMNVTFLSPFRVGRAGSVEPLMPSRSVRHFRKV